MILRWFLIDRLKQLSFVQSKHQHTHFLIQLTNNNTQPMLLYSSTIGSFI
eukprot:UN07620